MANRAGLKKVTKTVRGKHGSVRRSYWVKAAKVIGGAAALAGAAYLGHRALKRHGVLHSSGKSMIWKGSVAHPSQSANARVWKHSVGHPDQQASKRVAPGSVAHPGGPRSTMQTVRRPGLLTQVRDKLVGAKTWKGSVAHKGQSAGARVWSGSVAARRSRSTANIWRGSVANR